MPISIDDFYHVEKKDPRVEAKKQLEDRCFSFKTGMPMATLF